MSVQESQPVNGSTTNGHPPPAYSERMGNGQTESEQSLAILTPNDSVLEDVQGVNISKTREVGMIFPVVAANGHQNGTTKKDQPKDSQEGPSEARSGSNSIKMSVVAQPSESNDRRSPVPAVFSEKELKLMKHHSPQVLSSRKRDGPGSPDAKEVDQEGKILQQSDNHAEIKGQQTGDSRILAESGLTHTGTHQGFAVSEIAHSSTAYKITITNPEGQNGDQESSDENEPNPEPTKKDQANVRRISMRLYNLPPPVAPEGTEPRKSINRLSQNGQSGHMDASPTVVGGRHTGTGADGGNQPATGRGGDKGGHQPEHQPLVAKGKQTTGKDELFEMVNQVIAALRRARQPVLSSSKMKRKPHN